MTPSSPIGLAVAPRVAKDLSPAPPYLLGPGQWHEAISPHGRLFLEHFTDVMEQWAAAWDAQHVSESRQFPDVGLLVSISERMVTDMRKITETRLDDAEFLFLDEP